ncbi:MAG: hypothetical protein KF810_20350 [Rhizobiaceae bacterium]|nr:hypothetical protein [Rhizobiaceae bacterium]
MKRLLLAAMVFALLPRDAFAIVRYMVQDMTCSEVQAAVERDGVAILYRKAGPSGTPLYDRYVANQSFCQGGQITIKEAIPTADTKSCRVSKCIDQNRFGSDR